MTSLLERLAKAIESDRGESLFGERTSFPIEELTRDDIFERERQLVLRAIQPVVSLAELALGRAVSRSFPGGSILVTRDEAGEVRAFHNVCRHRGTRLLSEKACSVPGIVCPYHGWTYGLGGQLAHVPDEKNGFAGLDKSQLTLKPVPCAVQAGFVWARFGPTDLPAPLFGELREDIDGLALDRHAVFDSFDAEFDFNWKIGVTGFLETYHVKVAHRESVGPYFLSNRSVFDVFGPNLRLVTAMKALVDLPREKWELRLHTNTVYFLFPSTFFFVNRDHVILMGFEPVAVDRTRVRYWFLVPETPKKGEAYWKSNAEIFAKTAGEDFAISTSIQDGLRSGVNGEFTIGSCEDAIRHFRESLKR